MSRRAASAGSGIQVVWFKRDLRLHDHAPLQAAASQGPVLPLYVVEPDYWALPDHAARQWSFARECLGALREALAELGGTLMVRIGDVPSVLQALHESAHGPIGGLWSHEETGLAWTWERDKRVAAWARSAGVPWTELPQFGVVRKLKSRNGWAAKWDRFMGQAQIGLPRGVTWVEGSGDPIPMPKTIGLASDPCPERQTGGRREGLEVLESFLFQRGKHYRREMSSPVTAYGACSRLSPYLAWGAVSMREAAQAGWSRLAALRGERGEEAKAWRQSIDSFVGRLHWHCHFMQKLEDAPDLEHRNLHRGYDGMRETAFDRPLFEAYTRAETGLPFVDACLRALAATGWINFRMRAMLTAVSSYHLWLHWREPGQFLARRFTDFEPGIHYPQVQMQSGTTGINTVRIYNPIKQSKDQDPEGVFIRRWLPELAGLDDKAIHEPWTLSAVALKAAGVRLGTDYPMPIVDHTEAAKEARRRVYEARKSDAFRAEADAIQAKHGSRKSGLSQVSARRRAARKARDTRQTSFDWGGES